MGKTLTNLTLIALEKALEGYIQFEDFAYNPHKYLYGYPKNLNKSSLLRIIRRLRQNGLIELSNNENIEIKLTDKGRDRAVWERIKQEESKWDGKWRLVIFDIPEKRRQARDILRSKLKEWGFVPWQKSVWACKKDCTQPLRNFITQIGIEDWVMVLESDNVGIRTK